MDKENCLEISRITLGYPGSSAGTWRNIPKASEEVVVLEDFSLRLEKGKSLAIVGESGSGKTSILYAIAGLLAPSRGSIEVGRQLLPQGIMFQEDRLLPWKRVLDNTLLGLDKREYLPAALRWLEKTGIAGHAHKFPGQLSGGERQRAALSRLLCREPGLLLLDEPFAALDEQTREALQSSLRALIRELGLTMVLVTHNLEEALVLGEELVILKPQGESKPSFRRMKNPSYLLADQKNNPLFFETLQEARRLLKGKSDNKNPGREVQR